MSLAKAVRSWVLAGVAGAVALLALTPVCSGRPDTAASGVAPTTPRDAVRTVEVREPIPYPTQRRASSELRSGASKTLRAGIDGILAVTYRITTRDDKLIRRERLSEKIVRKPVEAIVADGTAPGTTSRGRLASRGGYYSGRRVLRMTATGYDASPASNGGTSKTMTGFRVTHGLVAVDPRIIPIGAHLYIEGYGHAVAADVGGAIKGYRIDLGHDSRRGANNIGRRTVIVHILD